MYIKYKNKYKPMLKLEEEKNANLYECNNKSLTLHFYGYNKLYWLNKFKSRI